jgi:outer membrane protein OmpA-like peptidoglycan-associated protein
MRVGLRFTVACVLLVAFAAGCTCMQKPWGMGALSGGVAGAVGGGIASGASTNNTGAFNIGNDNEDKALAIATGAIGGALLGALVGHCLLDRDAAIAPPPPPPPAPAPAPVQKKIVLRGVNFDFNKANIRADATPILKEAAIILNDNAALKISVEGHTDSKGSDDYNLKLSMRRATAVKAFLAHAGVAESRLSKRGLGESQPVASNETDDGRAQNRRVELKVQE